MKSSDRYGKESEIEYAHLSLTEMGTLGDCYATFEGQRINVFGGIVGEKVIARIIRFRRRRKNHISGIVTTVLKESPHRISALCPYFGPCSGCQWQHISYSHQLTLKTRAVENQLSRYSELDDIAVSPTIPSRQKFYYRNHARFTVRNNGSLGFNNRITRRFVRIDECLLMTPGINSLLLSLQGKSEETTQLSIRYGINTGDYLIQPTLQNIDLALQSGQRHYLEKLHGQIFRVASPSFFQVNTIQAEKMITLIRDRLELRSNDILIDAYAGVGVFAILLAPHVNQVIAIEESHSAIQDAIRNLGSAMNIKFVEEKTEIALDALDNHPDVVILDPPRVGCNLTALKALIRRAPTRIAYVSCEPETLARDLSVLVNGGFKVKSLEPIDMFPQTYHIETITTLERV